MRLTMFLQRVKYRIDNEEGIALVTSLMLTLISLAIIMSLMYLMTSSIQRTGASKRYKTALEASYGGAELVVKDLIPQILQNYSSVAGKYSLVNLQMNTPSTCMNSKLRLSTSQWPAGCDTNLNPRSNPDLQISLQGTNNQPFTVYSKIVDTVGGNTDVSGLQLEGAGVAESVPVITPQHYPIIYRLEVQAERSINASEHSNISVLYAY